MFNFNVHKAIEVILYFAAKEKAANKTDIDLIKINKYCYFSEKEHLRRYLKPIFGDTYCALPEGPVPSAIYDILKWCRGDRNEFMANAFRSTGMSDKFPLKFYLPYYMAPLRGPNVSKFSKSEIEIMDEVFEKYHAIPSKELSVQSHDEIAWKSAYSENRNEMDFSEIIGDSEAWNYISGKQEESQVFRASFQLQP
jgi:uncharacterized phage-associated protein